MGTGLILLQRFNLGLDDMGAVADSLNKIPPSQFLMKC